MHATDRPVSKSQPAAASGGQKRPRKGSSFGRFFLLGFTSALLAGSVHAEVLQKFDFNNFAPNSEATTVYAGSFSRGAYVNSSSIRKTEDPENLSYLVYTFDPHNHSNPWDGDVLRGTIRQNPAGAGIYIVDDAAAIARNSYFAITFTPTTQTSFTQLTLNAAAHVFDPDGEFEEIFDYGMVLRSSLTGWTADDGLGDALVDAGMLLGQQQQLSFDLSGVSELQNVTEPVTFRFYMNTNGANGSRTFYLDDLTVHGTTVPEPASIGLAIGGASLLLMRRHRHRA